MLTDEDGLINDLDNLKGRTVAKAVKWKSHDGVVKLLQITFTDATYCNVVADDPRIDVNLMADTERVIPIEKQLRLASL